VHELNADKLVEGLNAAQRDAVLHGGADGATGPLIVLAGPGTGKTRVIIHRIARIIADGADPESILAVTFTNKAAGQLRERLAELVGSTLATRVRAQTFHALGLSLVRRFASDLGLPPIRRDAAILDSAQRLRLVREAITTQGLFASRRAKGIDTLAELVQHAMRALANRAIEPETCTAFLETWRARLDQGQDSTGAVVDEPELAAESARLDEFRDISLAYTWFQAECRRRGWLGFEDLIMLSIRALREVPRVAALVRAEFRHALVDEFQDVNAGQIEFLRLLFPPVSPAQGSDHPPGPDLCIVGDDDQAIYGFRGADDQAFERFDRIWPGSRRILLTENYRSQTPIIAAANRVISLAEHRFAPDKLVARASSLAARPPEPGAGVTCIELTQDSDGGAAIATSILLDRAAGSIPNLPWSKYAVVCRNNSDITRVVADLELEGIPARGSYGDPLGEDSGVQDVLAWITLLVNPRETWPVRRILTRPPLAAEPLAAMEYEKRFRGERMMRGEDSEEPSFLQWVSAAAADDAVIGAAVQRLVALHRRLADLTSTVPAPQAIEQIITLTDAAHGDLLPARQRARRINALIALVRLARLSHAKLDQPGDLREFRRYWQDLDDEDRSLRQVGGIDDRTSPNDDDEDEGDDSPAVTVISAHKAKGLEWDTVFVPRVTPVHGYGKAGRNDPDPLPAGLLSQAGDSPDADRRAAEERRIFYVAATRAQRRLFLLSKRNKNPSKSTHYFEEFTRDPNGKALVHVLDIADLRQKAAAKLGRDDLLSAVASSHNDLGGDVIDRARLAVRLAAAEALEFADRPDAAADDVAAASARLGSAAAKLAIVSHIAATRAAPDWIDRDPDLAKYAATLLRIVSRADNPPVDAPRPPLELSYTAIDAYTRCPRCYWLRFVKGLPETQRKQTVLGTVVHSALESFYRAVRDAESVGLEPPSLGTLLRFGREEFMAAWPPGVDLDRNEFDQALAQLTVAHQKLHDPSSQVLELEKNINWQYTVPADDSGSPATTHHFSAKIDRIDQTTLADGRSGFRVVDYKSGQAWKKLTHPPLDDLQFGIYALALPHLLPDLSLSDVVGEYWLLSSGERGVIPFASLRLDKVEKVIHAAVRGILAGDFEPANDCNGDCRILRAPLGVG
jgi:DNA helicase-2/ATP-dependent DNA helicase PcrA